MPNHDRFSSATVFGRSTTLPSAGSFAAAPAFASVCPFAFCDVEFNGSSFVYGKNSGEPGIYFRNTGGTSSPSSFCQFSSTQHSARSVAHSVLFKAWTYVFWNDASVCFFCPYLARCQ